MKLALRVKELVDSRGWNLQDFVSQTGLDAETAQRLYQGQSTQIDLSTLGKLCELFGALPNEIVVRVDEPQPSVAEGAPMPRSIDVPVQGIDEVNKARPELKDGPGSDADRIGSGVVGQTETAGETGSPRQ